MKLKLVPIVIVSLVILLNIITLVPRYNYLSNTLSNVSSHSRTIVIPKVKTANADVSLGKTSKVIPKVTIVYTKRCLDLRAYVHTYGMSTLKKQYAASNEKLTPDNYKLY